MRLLCPSSAAISRQSFDSLHFSRLLDLGTHQHVTLPSPVWTDEWAGSCTRSQMGSEHEIPRWLYTITALNSETELLAYYVFSAVSGVTYLTCGFGSSRPMPLDGKVY